MSEIKCAVCKEGKGPVRCKICGFSDNGVISREFVTVEDANHWLDIIVKPYRIQWEARKREAELLSQIDDLKKQEKKLETQLKASVVEPAKFPNKKIQLDDAIRAKENKLLNKLKTWKEKFKELWPREKRMIIFAIIGAAIYSVLGVVWGSSFMGAIGAILYGIILASCGFYFGAIAAEKIYLLAIAIIGMIIGGIIGFIIGETIIIAITGMVIVGVVFLLVAKGIEGCINNCKGYLIAMITGVIISGIIGGIISNIIVASIITGIAGGIGEGFENGIGSGVLKGIVSALIVGISLLLGGYYIGGVIGMSSIGLFLGLIACIVTWGINWFQL
jgi:hypothetical protein